MTDKLKFPLFFTRLAIFYFLLPWVLMRFTKPEGSKGIATKYYKLPEMSDMINTGIGVLWVLLLLAFLIGFKKRISYGLVLVIHALGTLFTLPFLMIGTEKMNIMFFAAIPVIGAMWLLYTLREHDTFLSLNK